MNTTGAFNDPLDLRTRLLRLPIRYDVAPVCRGAHFYVHLTGLCNIACDHCMYSSDMNPPERARTRLEADDIALTLRYINDSNPHKVTISGGGEPFLSLDHLLTLVAQARCAYLEVITAGGWAKTPQAAARILSQLADAARVNSLSPRLVLRISADRFHTRARNPVTIDHYCNIVRAWQHSSDADVIELGFRGLQLEDDDTFAQLTKALHAQLLPVNSWNSVLEIDGTHRVPCTFNILRFSGKGHDHAHLANMTPKMADYFREFEQPEGRLVMGTIINDAIKGNYPTSNGISITLDYDGSLYIFSGCAPDMRASIRTHDFQQSVDHFFSDPITRLLLDRGVYEMFDMVRLVSPLLVADTIATNDICIITDRLLEDPYVRLYVMLSAVHLLIQDGTIALERQEDLFREVAAVSMDAVTRWARGRCTRRSPGGGFDSATE